MNWLAICSVVALTGSALLQGGDDPAQPEDPQSSEIPAGQQVTEDEIVETLALDDMRNQRLTVPVTIGDAGPFNFMVDTGAQATVLSAELADELQFFERESATLIGMASQREVETTIVPGFTLGSRTFTIRTAPIVERNHIGNADGILGLDSLQDLRVLFDFRNSELVVSERFGDGGANGYDITVRARERRGQLIIHRAEIDGVRTAVIVDTGAQGSVGNLALQDRLRRRELLGEAVITDVNGVRISSETRVARRLNLGRAEINNFAVSFADSPTFHALDLADRPAMILGMNELRLFERVAIDFRSNRVLFDIPGTVPNDQAWNFNSRATRLD